MEDVTVGIMSLVVLFAARASTLHPAAAPLNTETGGTETGASRAHATTEALAASGAGLGLDVAGDDPCQGGNQGEVDQRTKPIAMSRFHDGLLLEG